MTTRRVSHDEAGAARVTVGHGLIETGHRIAAWDTLGDYIEQQREKEALAAADDAVLEAAELWFEEPETINAAKVQSDRLERAIHARRKLRGSKSE